MRLHVAWIGGSVYGRFIEGLIHDCESQFRHQSSEPNDDASGKDTVDFTVWSFPTLRHSGQNFIK